MTQVSQRPPGVHISMTSAINPYAEETLGYPTGIANHVEIRPHDNAQKGQHRIKVIEQFYVRPRWIFIRIETETGVVGWSEATLESHSEAMEGAFKDVARKYVWRAVYNVLTVIDWWVGMR
jgi:galactonate dehydratase